MLRYFNCLVDVNECATGQNNCHSNASCANTPGGFTCTCNAGYIGDGITCTGNGIVFTNIP